VYSEDTTINNTEKTNRKFELQKIHAKSFIVVKL